MNKTTQKSKFGCIKVILVVVIVLVVLSLIASWYDQRPVQMLHRHLDTELTSSITRVETKYVGGMDYTAYIYLEGEPSALRAIIEKNLFRRSGGHTMDPMLTKLNFEDASQIVPDEVTCYRGTGSGSVMECLAISEDGRQLWYGAFDY